jgi:5'-deoxynucleotidase YfbR-like HD superfamily hydrolase
MRWNGENKTVPVSVLAHLVVVAFITYTIGMIENKSGSNLSILELMMK